MTKKLTCYLFTILTGLISFQSVSLESSFKGLADFRFYYVDSNTANSYLNGGYGKFRYDHGSGIAIGQLGAQWHVDFNSNWSSTIVGNAFVNKDNEALGITEAYISYKGLPNKQGWRIKSKLGIFYPVVSLENIATAWSTPYTLTSSSLNNWLGEEFRNTGASLTIEKLGKFTHSKHNFSIDFSLFQNNDTAGAMLTWHGWTIGSRQTLLGETLPVQYFPARKTTLAKQAAESDPFKELDHRSGYHLAGNWKYANKFKLNLGYYDNNAKEGLVEQGQYTWTTDFTHLGLKYRFAKEWELLGQHMRGRTYMTSPTRVIVVDADYKNTFVILRHFWNKHHIALRFEDFSVTDRDLTWGDNNNENGQAWALAYRYKFKRNQFIITEFNWIDSTRPARWYVGQQQDKIERQLQLGYRIYF